MTATPAAMVPAGVPEAGGGTVADGASAAAPDIAGSAETGTVPFSAGADVLGAAVALVVVAAGLAVGVFVSAGADAVALAVGFLLGGGLALVGVGLGAGSAAVAVGALARGAALPSLSDW